MPADDEDRRQRILLGLEGLVPIVWMERVATRCADPRHPKREELFPTDAERRAVVDVLVMADGLAIGQPSKSPGSLAALAKAIVMLAAAPGGVKVFGKRWEIQDLPDGARLTETAADGKQDPKE